MYINQSVTCKFTSVRLLAFSDFFDDGTGERKKKVHSVIGIVYVYRIFYIK